MAQSQESGPGLVAAGRRQVSAHGGSVEVTIPACVAQFLGLGEGEEVLVTRNGEAVVIHPTGVPLTPTIDTFGGHRTVQEHNGSKRVVIPSEVASEVGITPGTEVGFQFNPGKSVVKAIPG